MKDTKNILIISLIVHLLVFMILAYITLPPVARFREFLESLSVNFVEVKPVVRELRPPENVIEQEQVEEAETQEMPKPPKLISFSVSTEEPVSDAIRVTSSEARPTFKTARPKIGMASGHPLTVKPVSRSADHTDAIMVPDFQQEEIGRAHV